MRLPVIPTLFVAVAAACMVGLGLWQLLDRRPAKLAFIEQLRTNPAKPPVAFPRVPDERLLYRRSSAMCLQPSGITRAGAGAKGFRLIAQCRTGAEGPGLLVQIGTSRDPSAQARFTGGEVQGYLAHEPDSRPLIAALFDRTPRRLMIVADRPAPGLSPNAPPDPDTVSNNHLAYAGQWFFFAAVAVVIYLLALRRRSRT